MTERNIIRGLRASVPVEEFLRGPKEVLKRPIVPFLDDRSIDLLTRICFRQNDDFPMNSETLFVFGSTEYLPNMTDEIHEIVKNEKLKNLMLTGGVSKMYNGQLLSEPEIIWENIKSFVPPDIQVYFEEASKSTLENLLYILEIYKFKPDEHVVFTCKPYVAGRCFLTLKKYLPNNPIYQRSFKTFDTDSHQWADNEEGRSRVWGEFLRIQKYGSRGDIAYEPVREFVDEVLSRTNTKID